MPLLAANMAPSKIGISDKYTLKGYVLLSQSLLSTTKAKGEVALIVCIKAIDINE